MMQNYIDILRQLNYELVKELGLFKHRAGLSFSQRHILYHIKNNISLSMQELADFLCQSFHGGPDLTPALLHAIHILDFQRFDTTI